LYLNATLQHQRNNFEWKILCRLHNTRLDLGVHDWFSMQAGCGSPPPLLSIMIE
jgi:hypothetical protein